MLRFALNTHNRHLYANVFRLQKNLEKKTSKQEFWLNHSLLNTCLNLSPKVIGSANLSVLIWRWRRQAKILWDWYRQVGLQVSTRSHCSVAPTEKNDFHLKECLTKDGPEFNSKTFTLVYARGVWVKLVESVYSYTITISYIQYTIV